jgi:alpha-mannosidase
MKDVYMIGNAHLDPVWLWRKPEGMAEVLSTFRSALDRMKEFPGYVFTCACAAYYVWVEKTDPDMFMEIRERVAQGRWSITGGFWIQPDCNLPAGEAFARHALYSQRYFLEKFGVIATVGYNVDSFGHNGMFPQLLRKSGMDSYVFMRPDNNENNRLPGSAFIWESPDGSRVSVFHITHGYGSSHWDYAHMPEYKEYLPAYAKALHLQSLSQSAGYGHMSFYGVGNHGGGPAIRDLKALEPLTRENPGIVFASTRDYFDALTEKSGQLPVWREDLQHHASGCYAADSVIKALNRRSENSLIAAEQYDVMAMALTGAKSLQADIRNGWEKVMFNQFHDILAGCCIREAARDAKDAFGAACDTASQVQMLALQRIARKIRTTGILDDSPAQKNGWILWEKEGEGAPVILFNPHAFPITCPSQVNADVLSVTDHQGHPVVVQTVRGPQTNGSELYSTLFLANVPAWGYAVYHMYKSSRMDAPALPCVTAASHTLENEYLKVSFDPHTGLMTEFWDKSGCRQLAGAPMCKPLLIENGDADTWAHGIFAFDKEVDGFHLASVDVLESGPIRAAIRVTGKCASSTVTQTFRLVQGQKWLEVKCTVDFREKLKLLKLSFPAAVENPIPIYSMPSGFLAKQADGLEEPAHKWVAVVSEHDGMGLALLNDGRYSFSCKENDLRMAVARGAIFADHFGRRDDQVEYMDQGELTFTYALMPCCLEQLQFVVKAAALLNRPASLLMEGHHSGALPPVYQGISIDTDYVIVQAAKLAENGRGYVIRFLETAGKATNATVDVALLHRAFPLSFAPQEIKTVYLPLSGSEMAETDFTERLS